MLLKPVDELRRTDIAAHALEALAQSKVREVHLVGRRGPAQAKFTTRELRGLGLIPDCSAAVHEDAVVVGPACETELANRTNENSAQNVEFFRALRGSRRNGRSRRLTFHFRCSPEILEGAARVANCVLQKNTLQGGPFQQAAVATGEQLNIECGLVFSSIGYRGQPLGDIPFNAHRGIVPNRNGRVQRDGIPVAGLYVTGWLKRGPTGIIGTNRADSIETVQQLLEDLTTHGLEPKERRDVLVESLSPTGGIVTWQDWLKIDAAERARGQEAGKPREKFTRVAEMLGVVSSHRSCETAARLRIRS
jgi:ferredoxin--NADP+ reductase